MVLVCSKPPCRKVTGRKKTGKSIKAGHAHDHEPARFDCRRTRCILRRSSSSPSRILRRSGRSREASWVNAGGSTLASSKLTREETAPSGPISKRSLISVGEPPKPARLSRWAARTFVQSDFLILFTSIEPFPGIFPASTCTKRRMHRNMAEEREKTLISRRGSGGARHKSPRAVSHGPENPRVLHVLYRLGRGGTENQCVSVATHRANPANALRRPAR